MSNRSVSTTLVSMSAAAQRLGVGRNTIRRHLPIVQVGRRVLVRVADIEAKAAGERSNVAA